MSLRQPHCLASISLSMPARIDNNVGPICTTTYSRAAASSKRQYIRSPSTSANTSAGSGSPSRSNTSTGSSGSPRTRSRSSTASASGYDSTRCAQESSSHLAESSNIGYVGGPGRPSSRPSCSAPSTSKSRSALLLESIRPKEQHSIMLLQEMVEQVNADVCYPPYPHLS
jgi:hypothetical protein